MGNGTAADRWRDALDARRIPPELLERAPESPWGFPVGLFEVRARKAGGEASPTTRRALAALPPDGTPVTTMWWDVDD